MLHKQIVRWSLGLILSSALISSLSSLLCAQTPAGPNLMANMNGMDATAYIDNPWGGVQNGVISMNPGVQLAVDEEGHIVPTVFGPSCAVGDLNGDGLPDLVIADARGYFWYFPNSGTPKAPKFTTGEIMPIWIGVPVAASDDPTLVYSNYDAVDNTVPRIQLVDYTGEKKLSIIAGNYEGKLFYIHNTGTPTAPSFSMPNDLASITVDTYSRGFLWCNFLAPFLYDFTGNGQLDLVMGEGTYASNSIYRIVNKGNNGSPVFSDKATTKIIPGYGREHLNPQVADFNGDGKPDIVSGERLGFIDLWLNTSPDNDPKNLQFGDVQKPQHLKFGDLEQLGALSTVAVCDLNGSKLPSLMISNSDNHISYAQNIGTAKEPKYGAPVPVTATTPMPKVFAPPANWSVFKSFSMPYVGLVSTKLKDDPSFKPPDDAPTIKSALKIYTVPHAHNYFLREVYPTEDSHIVRFNDGIPLQAGTHYDLSFYCKSSGNVENLRYFFAGREDLAPQGVTMGNGDGARYIYLPNTMSGGSTWTKITGDVYVEKADRAKEDVAAPQFFFAFNGNGGTVWVTGFSLTKRR